VTSAEDKLVLRRRVRELRRHLGADYRSQASQRARERLVELIEVAGLRLVALYAAQGPEADPSAALGHLVERDIEVVFPRVVGDLLEFAPASSLEELEPGYRGVLEPRERAIDLAALDAIVVPGVAFDKAGARLGQGGGHYDRTLARIGPGPLRIGFAFSCQVVEQVPRAAHDELIDAVVTEDETIYTSHP
jgi:5-formyltetrahydrofolate cyclo-ligase